VTSDTRHYKYGGIKLMDTILTKKENRIFTIVYMSFIISMYLFFRFYDIEQLDTKLIPYSLVYGYVAIHTIIYFSRNYIIQSRVKSMRLRKLYNPKLFSRYFQFIALCIINILVLLMLLLQKIDYLFVISMIMPLMTKVVNHNTIYENDEYFILGDFKVSLSDIRHYKKDDLYNIVVSTEHRDYLFSFWSVKKYEVFLGYLSERFCELDLSVSDVT